MKTILLLLSVLTMQAAPIRRLDPDVLIWQTNVAFYGGGVKPEILYYVNAAVDRLKKDNLYDKAYAINLLAGTNLASALVRVRFPSTIAAQETNRGGFVDGDFVELGASRGMTGNGTSKYTDTRVNLSALSGVVNSNSVWCWCYTTAAGGTSQTSIGVQGASGAVNFTGLGWLNAGALETGGSALSSTAEYAPGSASSLTGWLGVNNNSTRNQQYYRNGATVGATASASGAFANTNIFYHALNSAGAAATFCNRRLGPTVIAKGYTQVEIRKLYAAINQFEQEMLSQ